ncbi:MAG: glycerate kinase [Leptolyngbyaceae cyanobacterium CSU_1_3]|nr:glycerate kinase [Leptolyngbyaceae cyanobacterium CSU_1_3]
MYDRASDRENAFGNTPEKALSKIELIKKIYPEFSELCQKKLKLEMPLDETLWSLWLPLGMQIAKWRNAQTQPLIQGFLGGQGTGKTTLTEILTLILKHLGYHTISFSLDDLYLTHADRRYLQTQDPRLARRGPPGTHDLNLGLQILNQLKRGEPTQIPQFDKSLWQGDGDRIAPKLVSEVDIVLFEGWFVGVRPIDSAQFENAPHPIVTAADRAFARDMNDRLQSYVPLWEQLDRLIVLYVPDYCLSQQWRKAAEHQMIAQGKPGMSDGEIEAFVEYFWRALHPQLFIEPMITDANWVDFVIPINSDHSSGAVRRVR